MALELDSVFEANGRSIGALVASLLVRTETPYMSFAIICVNEYSPILVRPCEGTGLALYILQISQDVKVACKKHMF